MNQKIVLNSPGQFGNYSASYSLTLYPNDELFDVYSTNNPVVANEIDLEHGLMAIPNM
jgi:hypothetical protein